ncbi:mis18-binding protein 1 isoform X2 [Syngnathus typhle]|uniref:mis18-binding protein 1 isoform X2 n=1 Tax=Syngnathus typhle TaxID=161592 RepID=UPI002A6A6DA7|nr:mis18-binding protein 1 isoform X2 [Syngnathus typhle]
MASYQCALQCPHTLYQSPAKVFAKLKKKVQDGEQTTCGVGQYATQMTTGWSGRDHFWDLNELQHKFGEEEALTISPIKSPQKSDGYSYAMELPDTTNALHRFKSPMGRFLESTYEPRVCTDPHSTRDPRQIIDKNVANEISPTDSCMPSVSSFSPARKKLRKRKAEETNMIFCDANVTSEIEDDSIDTVGHRCTPKKTSEMESCRVSLERLMSPAKIFAFMKEKVSRREREQDNRDCQEPGEPPDGVGCQRLEIGPGVSQEFADNQSETRHPEEDSPLNVTSESILFDPILLNEPSICIPKKHSSLFKNKQKENLTKIPYENAINLKEWFLRRNHNGIFVEGIRMENRTPWNSNIIVERISSTVLKTLSGNVYILVGKMNLHMKTDFPRWLLRLFAHGFPANWKALYHKFLAELKESKVNTVKASKTTEKSAPAPTIKRHKEAPVQKTNTSAFFQKVTRSGRTIKPPLEYWKGGRIFLDADFNTTIYDNYNSLSLNSDVSKVVPEAKSKKTTQAIPLSDKGHTQSESSRDSVPSATPKRDKRPQSQSLPEANHSASPKVAVKRPSRHAVNEESKNDNALPSSQPKKLPQQRSKAKPCNAPLKNGNALPSSQPKKLPQQRSKAKPCNAPLRRSARKNTPLQLSTANENSLASEDEQSRDKEERRSNHAASAHENTRPKPQKFPRKESKKKALKSPALNKSEIKLASQLSADKEILEEEQALSAWRKKQDKKGHPSPSHSQNLPVQEPKRRRGRKRPPPRFYAQEEEVQERPSPHTSDSSDQSDIENTSPSKKTSQKGSKTKGSKTKGSKTKGSKTKGSKTKGSNTPPSRREEAVKRSKRKPRKQNRNPNRDSAKLTSPAKLTQSNKKVSPRSTESPQAQDEDQWTQDEEAKLQQALSRCFLSSPTAFCWENVATMVGTRSAEECYYKDMALRGCHVPGSSTGKKQKKKAEPPKPTDCPVISAGIGTFKRKQQVRQFLETMPRENTDDAFSAPHNEGFEFPPLCLDGTQDFHLEPMSPSALHFSQAKTPRCRHASPGVMHSTNMLHGDKLVFNLQKAIKQTRVNGCKKVPAKNVAPPPSVKRTTKPIKNLGNDSIFIQELFSMKPATLLDSGEEEDFYFSDSD